MIHYPIARRAPTRLEKVALAKYFRLVFFDNVCGRWTRSKRIDANFRESLISRASGAVNRHRQISFALLKRLESRTGSKVASLNRLATTHSELAVYNTESSGPIHEALKGLPNYRSSEYLGPSFTPGQQVNGKLHQDLMRLTFQESSFDFVISGDVFEHIPDPYLAHREVFRVLKSGGSHVFTVPFYQTEYRDEVRARLDEDGKIVHLLEPLYHHDPVRPEEGVLVYTIFALEMLVKLKEIGFETAMLSLYQPRLGILGNNSIVFEARKP